MRTNPRDTVNLNSDLPPIDLDKAEQYAWEMFAEWFDMDKSLTGPDSQFAEFAHGSARFACRRDDLVFKWCHASGLSNYREYDVYQQARHVRLPPRIALPEILLYDFDWSFNGDADKPMNIIVMPFIEGRRPTVAEWVETGHYAEAKRLLPFGDMWTENVIIDDRGVFNLFDLEGHKRLVLNPDGSPHRRTWSDRRDAARRRRLAPGPSVIGSAYRLPPALV